MDSVYSTYGMMRNTVRKRFWFGSVKDHLEDLGIDGDNIQINLSKTGLEDWIYVAQDRARVGLIKDGVLVN